MRKNSLIFLLCVFLYSCNSINFEPKPVILEKESVALTEEPQIEQQAKEKQTVHCMISNANNNSIAFASLIQEYLLSDIEIVWNDPIELDNFCDVEVLKELTKCNNSIDWDIDIKYTIEKDALDEETSWLYAQCHIILWHGEKKLVELKEKLSQGIVLWRGRAIAEERALHELAQLVAPKILPYLQNKLPQEEKETWIFLVENTTIIPIIQEEISHLEQKEFFSVINTNTSSFKLMVELNNIKPQKSFWQESLWNSICQSYGYQLEVFSYKSCFVFKIGMQ